VYRGHDRRVIGFKIFSPQGFGVVVVHTAKPNPNHQRKIDPMTDISRDELVAALSRLPEKDANSIISEARQHDRQQAMERAAPAVRALVGGQANSKPGEPSRSLYRKNKWRLLALRVIKEEPTCWLRLPGCTHRSTTADHIIPVSVRPDLAFVRTNCRGACHSCNSLRRDTPITQLAELRAELNARPMTRQQAVEILRANRYRQRAPALSLFD
jgi:hypothetical protein